MCTVFPSMYLPSLRPSNHSDFCTDFMIFFYSNHGAWFAIRYLGLFYPMTNCMWGGGNVSTFYWREIQCTRILYYIEQFIIYRNKLLTLSNIGVTLGVQLTWIYVKNHILKKLTGMLENILVQLLIWPKKSALCS